MVNNNSSQNGGKPRENIASKSTYFVGSWLRQFLLANYDLVGKTFEMMNVCICIDLVTDTDQYDDGSVAYRITDTDLSIRAIFTANSLKSASSSKETVDLETPDSVALARSPVVLQECRLIHLAIPGTEHGDFALEVRNFIWENNRKISKQKVENILHWAPQYIWCAEDPKLQEVLKKASDKRGCGILGTSSVTNHLGLLFEELIGGRNVTDTSFIPPEIKAAIGLNNFDENNCGKKQTKIAEDENTCIGSESGSRSDKGVLKNEAESTEKTVNHRKTKKSSKEFVNGKKRKQETKAFPRTFLVSDSQCSQKYLQPFVHLKRLSLAEISNINLMGFKDETSFFFDSMRNKRVLPKWKPKIIKNPTKSARKKKLIENSWAAVFAQAVQPLLSENGTYPEQITPFDCPNTDNGRNLIEPEIVCEDNEVIDLSDDQTMSCEDDLQEVRRFPKRRSKKIIDVFDDDQITSCEEDLKAEMKRLSRRRSKKVIDVFDDHTMSCEEDLEVEMKRLSRRRSKNHVKTKETDKGGRQKFYGSVYQDVFSKWLDNPCDTGKQLAQSIKLLTNSGTSPSDSAKKRKLSEETDKKNSPTQNSSEVDLLDLLSLTNRKTLIPKVVLTRLPPDVKFNRSKKLNFRGKSTSSMYLSHKDPVDLLNQKQSQVIVLDSDEDSDIEIVFESPTLSTPLVQQGLETNFKSSLTSSPLSCRSKVKTREECSTQSEEKNNDDVASSELCDDHSQSELSSPTCSAPILKDILTSDVEKTTTSLSVKDKTESSENEDKLSCTTNSPLLLENEDSEHELTLQPVSSLPSSKKTDKHSVDKQSDLNGSEANTTPVNAEETIENKTVNEMTKEDTDCSSNPLPSNSEETVFKSPDALQFEESQTTVKNLEVSPSPTVHDSPCVGDASNDNARSSSPIQAISSNVETTDVTEVVNSENNLDCESELNNINVDMISEKNSNPDSTVFSENKSDRQLSEKLCTSNSDSAVEAFKTTDKELEIQLEDSSAHHHVSAPAEATSEISECLSLLKDLLA